MKAVCVTDQQNICSRINVRQQFGTAADSVADNQAVTSPVHATYFVDVNCIFKLRKRKNTSMGRGGKLQLLLFNLCNYHFARHNTFLQISSITLVKSKAIPCVLGLAAAAAAVVVVARH